PIHSYFDEHVRSAPLTRFPRTRGIDVLTAQEALRAGQEIDDADQLAFATAQGRVLVSSDNHFLNPKVVPQLASGLHAGIVRLKDNVRIGEQGRYLRYIAQTETMATMAGQIRYYEPIPRGLFADD
nr:DUF5615 family PIN-like protein [Ktedonobacterales bacterium]